jgi:hypothetical protein
MVRRGRGAGRILPQRGCTTRDTVSVRPVRRDSILLQVTVGCFPTRCGLLAVHTRTRFPDQGRRDLATTIRYAACTSSPPGPPFDPQDGECLIIPQPRCWRSRPDRRPELPGSKGVGAYANQQEHPEKFHRSLRALKARGWGSLLRRGDRRRRAPCGDPQRSPRRLHRHGQEGQGGGILLSVPVLTGIGGEAHSLRHARATGNCLTAMARYVGALTVMLLRDAPLRGARPGALRAAGRRVLLQELREMIRHTDLSRGFFFSNHAQLPAREATVSGGKEKAIALIRCGPARRGRLQARWMRAL